VRFPAKTALSFSLPVQLSLPQQNAIERKPFLFLVPRRKLPDVVAMVDIAPTILQLAGVRTPSGAAEMDGRVSKNGLFELF
jgi:hypothetical protein